ncbi:MAG: response regulator [Pirellulaceae bacterium]|nr:response regulator [Pirellulaceae bacterium]
MVDWSNQPILIVEDSPEDFEATVRALHKSGLRNTLFRCSDGEDALDFLHRRGEYVAPDSAPRPGLILLDLNLPGTDGREVLEEIKQDPSLKKIPVVVLTTSTDERDIEACYEFGANSYIHKPVDLAGLVDAIQRLKDYWFQIVVFPKTDS